MRRTKGSPIPDRDAFGWVYALVDGGLVELFFNGNCRRRASGYSHITWASLDERQKAMAQKDVTHFIFRRRGAGLIYLRPLGDWASFKRRHPFPSRKELRRERRKEYKNSSPVLGGMQ